MRKAFTVAAVLLGAVSVLGQQAKSPILAVGYSPSTSKWLGISGPLATAAGSPTYQYQPPPYTLMGYDQTSNIYRPLCLTATGTLCGIVSGSGTGGYYSLWTGTGASTTLGVGHLDDGVSNTGAISSSEPLALLEGFAPSGSLTYDVVWADSSSHWLRFNPNNQGTYTVLGASSPGVAGSCWGPGPKGYDAVSVACGGSGSGSLPTGTGFGYVNSGAAWAAAIPGTGTGSVVQNNNPTFVGSDTLFANSVNSGQKIELRPGLSADQPGLLQFDAYGGTSAWQVGRGINTSNPTWLTLVDLSDGSTRLSFVPGMGTVVSTGNTASDLTLQSTGTVTVAGGAPLYMNGGFTSNGASLIGPLCTANPSNNCPSQGFQFLGSGYNGGVAFTTTNAGAGYAPNVAGSCSISGGTFTVPATCVAVGSVYGSLNVKIVVPGVYSSVAGATITVTGLSNTTPWSGTLVLANNAQASNWSVAQTFTGGTPTTAGSLLTITAPNGQATTGVPEFGIVQAPLQGYQSGYYWKLDNYGNGNNVVFSMASVNGTEVFSWPSSGGTICTTATCSGGGGGTNPTSTGMSYWNTGSSTWSLAYTPSGGTAYPVLETVNGAALLGEPPVADTTGTTQNLTWNQFGIFEGKCHTRWTLPSTVDLAIREKRCNMLNGIGGYLNVVATGDGTYRTANLVTDDGTHAGNLLGGFVSGGVDAITVNGVANTVQTAVSDTQIVLTTDMGSALTNVPYVTAQQVTGHVISMMEEPVNPTVASQMELSAALQPKAGGGYTVGGNAVELELPAYMLLNAPTWSGPGTGLPLRDNLILSYGGGKLKGHGTLVGQGTAIELGTSGLGNGKLWSMYNDIPVQNAGTYTHIDDVTFYNPAVMTASTYNIIDGPTGDESNRTNVTGSAYSQLRSGAYVVAANHIQCIAGDTACTTAFTAAAYAANTALNPTYSTAKPLIRIAAGIPGNSGLSAVLTSNAITSVTINSNNDYVPWLAAGTYYAAIAGGTNSTYTGGGVVQFTVNASNVISSTTVVSGGSYSGTPTILVPPYPGALTAVMTSGAISSVTISASAVPGIPAGNYYAQVLDGGPTTGTSTGKVGYTVNSSGVITAAWVVAGGSYAGTPQLYVNPDQLPYNISLSTAPTATDIYLAANLPTALVGKNIGFTLGQYDLYEDGGCCSKHFENDYFNNNNTGGGIAVWNGGGPYTLTNNSHGHGGAGFNLDYFYTAPSVAIVGALYLEASTTNLNSSGAAWMENTGGTITSNGNYYASVVGSPFPTIACIWQQDSISSSGYKLQLGPGYGTHNFYVPGCGIANLNYSGQQQLVMSDANGLIAPYSAGGGTPHVVPAISALQSVGTNQVWQDLEGAPLASASTITPTAARHHITGTAAISTIATTSLPASCLPITGTASIAGNVVTAISNPTTAFGSVSQGMVLYVQGISTQYTVTLVNNLSGTDTLTVTPAPSASSSVTYFIVPAQATTCSVDFVADSTPSFTATGNVVSAFSPAAGSSFTMVWDMTSVASAASAGYVGLGSWYPPTGGGSGSGTVSSGTAGQVGYYSASGSTISGDASLTDVSGTLTYSGANGESALAYTATGPNNGAVNLSETGTAATGPGANTIQLTVPNSITAYTRTFAGAAPTATSVPQYSTSGVESWLQTSTLATLAGANTWTAKNIFGGGDLFAGGVDAQTGTTYTMVAADENKLLTFNNASAVAVTLPVATTTGFTVGAVFTVFNRGAGTVTITPTTSTINGGATLVLATGQGAILESDGTNYSAAGPFGSGSGGSVSNYYTSTSYTGIGPTSFTPTHTLDVQDTTASTGTTTAQIKWGASGSNAQSFNVLDNSGNYLFGVTSYNGALGGVSMSSVARCNGVQTYAVGTECLVTKYAGTGLTASVTGTTISYAVPTYFGTISAPTTQQFSLSCQAEAVTAGTATLAATATWNDGTARSVAMKWQQAGAATLTLASGAMDFVSIPLLNVTAGQTIAITTTYSGSTSTYNLYCNIVAQ